MSNSPRGGLPAGLIGMLALVLGIERYVARHEPAFSATIPTAWQKVGGFVPDASRCAVVAMGDSLVKHGFVPPVLQERHDLSAYNLAVPKGMFPAHYFLLRRLLATGARPKAVLVDGELLTDDPMALVRVWPELVTLDECVELARAGRDAGFFGRTVMEMALPSYKARHDVRSAVMSAFDGKVLGEPASLPVVRRNWKKNSGGQVLPMPDFPSPDPRPAMLEATKYCPFEWTCNPLNDAYVTKFLDLAEAHGVSVYWLLPPYHPEVEIRRERYGLYPKYLAYLRGVQARHPGLTVIDGRHAGYPAEVFADMTHLSRTGALAYTDAIGSLLHDRLPGGANAGPRWVEIPRYDRASAEALASASDVEDVTQSGKALGQVMVEVRLKRERQLGRAKTSDDARRRQ